MWSEGETPAEPVPAGGGPPLPDWDRSMMVRLRRRLVVSILLSVSVVLSVLFYYNTWALQRDFELQREAHQREHSRRLHDALQAARQEPGVDLRAVAEKLAAADPDNRYVLTDDRGSVLFDAGGTLLGQDIAPLAESPEYSWVSAMFQHPTRNERFRFYVFWDREHLVTILLRNAHVNLGVSLLLCGVILLVVIDRLTKAANAEYEQLVVQVEALEEHRLKTEKFEALSTLGAGVAHEIRNPLNSIGMGIQRLQMEYASDERGSEFVEITQLLTEEVARVNRIVEEFLQFARPPRLASTVFDLTELVSETAAVYREDALAHSVDLSIDAMPGRAFVNADRDQIKQALVNLVRNAIQAAEEAPPPGGGGRVVVALSEAGPGYLAVRVTDNGPGIAPENVDRIFDIYFTTKHHGSGLGLAIVRRILDSHHSVVEVSSQPGATTFRFTLARVSAPATQEPCP